MRRRGGFSRRQLRSFRRAETRGEREPRHLPGWGDQHGPCFPQKARALRARRQSDPGSLAGRPRHRCTAPTAVHVLEGSARAVGRSPHPVSLASTSLGTGSHHYPGGVSSRTWIQGCCGSLPARGGMGLRWRRDTPRERPRVCAVLSAIALGPPSSYYLPTGLSFKTHTSK